MQAVAAKNGIQNINLIRVGQRLMLPGASTPQKPTLKSLETIAREVIRGDWGNGQERERRLTEAGYDASAVQKTVNRLL